MDFLFLVILLHPMYPQKQLAQLILSASQYYNIDTVVISPGSRNAPLTVGFSNLENIQTISIVDERCAAFFALGIAQQTEKPVVLVCTSGSALLNYYPAIAEAFYSKIPLIVISADRPKHLIDIGDGQTIRQENVFQNHILFSANLIEDDNSLQTNTKLLAEAYSTGIQQKGPVHINVPFNEPLYEVVEVFENKLFENTFLKENDLVAATSSEVNLTELSEIWNTAKKKLILVGVNNVSPNLQTILDRFAEDDSVLIMTETTSNLSNDKFINSIDKLITKLDSDGYEKLQPEVLITFGGMIISKRIKQFLRKYSPKHHWHIDPFKAMDTYFCLTEHIKETPEAFLEKLIENTLVVSSNYQSFWLKEKQARNVKHLAYIKEAKYSDFLVFNSVLKSIPDATCVQVSNSSIIRYMQLFDLNPTLSVYCNRGTSGIDGSTSTAIGAAYANKEQTLLITGDLSFFYDSNALWNTNIPNSFRIILLNNNGGGIFKIIPGPKSTNALNYFETPHNLTAEHLAKMFNLEYVSASSIEEVNNKLTDFYSDSERPKILEVFTPSGLNDTVLKEYFNSL